MAITLAFALNVDQHARFIDVAGFQLHQFGSTHAGGVQGDEDGAMEEVGG